jgi:hypothetical protein
MSRKRKPVVKPIAEATDELYWRARVISENVDNKRIPAEYVDSMMRLRSALQDYEASRTPTAAQGTLAL